jgi:hypothetical protein
MNQEHDRAEPRRQESFQVDYFKPADAVGIVTYMLDTVFHS